MARRLTLPADPLARFTELAMALKSTKRWFHSWESLRHAAVVLCTVPGPSKSVVADMNAAAETLKQRSGWFGPLKDGNRFQVAAMVVREGIEPGAFYDAVQRGREFFRQNKLRRSGFYEVLAILVLRAQSSSHRLQSSQFARLKAIHDALRKDHRWLTGRQDYPTIALLCGTALAPERIRIELEAGYRQLIERGYKAGDELLTAAHILHLAPAGRTPAHIRFDRIYQGFRDEGLRMNKGDYDEIAALALLSASPSSIVRRTLRHRDCILDFKPRPAKQLSFTVATGTTFVEMLHKDARELGPARTARMVNLQSILQAQQAAILAERRAAAAAAG